MPIPEPHENRRIVLRIALAGAIAAGINGCYGLFARRPEAPAGKTIPVEESIRPLPGGLDKTLVFNSNSPEVVQSPGILVSTLPALRDSDVAFLGEPFSGDFSVFSHHIAKDETPGQHLLYLGLIAANRNGRPVTLALDKGASYLSQPEALFKELAPVISDPQGTAYAGPGDRVATDLLHDRSPIPPFQVTLAPGANQLVYSLPIPTNVAILPPINGRSTLLRMHSDGEVFLSEVAYFAEKGPDGQFKPPTQEDYMALLEQGQLAGPREALATPLDATGARPAGRFQYGRVAGVSVGDRWSGRLFETPANLPGAGERVGFPIAAVYLNRMGTRQNQAPSLAARYADTAYQAHGNYGVTYELGVPLDNPTATPRTYRLTLSRPQSVKDGLVTYLDPPNRSVMFRGPVRLSWRDADGSPREVYSHLVLRLGEQVPPFATLVVPPHGHFDATLSLIYPADATPPELLTVSAE